MTKKSVHQVQLTEAEIAARDVARGFTDADLAEALDNPEWTVDQLRNARPFSEVFPKMAASIKKDPRDFK